MYPTDRRYSKEHEWVRVEGERGTVGITDHAQNQLGDVVFLELPEVGARLESGESFGTVESVKAVSELYAPVSGEVVEVNSALVDAPEKVNEDPHGEAWMVVVKLDDASAVDALLAAEDYQNHIAEEAK
jgi:glycine cleavage system H protein